MTQTLPATGKSENGWIAQLCQLRVSHYYYYIRIQVVFDVENNSSDSAYCPEDIAHFKKIRCSVRESEMIVCRMTTTVRQYYF